MEKNNLPDVVDETTILCRICLSDSEELYSIFDYGKVGSKMFKILDILTEFTSIEVNKL